MANADISLLFGVLGEGSLSGDSGKLIQSQLTQIMAELNKTPLKVKVGIDTTTGGKKSWSGQLQQKLDQISASGKFSAQISTLKLSPGAVSDFKKQLAAVVNTVGLSTGTQITISAKGIGEIKSKLYEAQEAIQKTGTDADMATRKIAEFRVQMEALTGQKNTVKQSLATLGKSAVTEDEKAQVAELIARYEQWAVKIEEVRAAKAAAPADQRAAIEAEGAAILTNIERLNAERIAREETAQTAEESSKRKANVDSQESASQEQRNAALRTGVTLLTQMEKAERDWTAAQIGSSKQNYAGIQSDIARLRELNQQFESGKITIADYRKELSTLQTSFSANSNAIKAAGENVKTLSARIGTLAQKFSAWFSITHVIMLGVRSVRRMVTATIELDDAMTQLKIVTRDTSQAYDEYLGKITETATKIGATVPDLIDSTTTFARLGYSLEESSALAEFTAMLQNVGDIDVSDAQDAITAIVKAFGISIDEIESVMDKMVITGNNFPISVSQIAEGMNNASSALAAAGNTFDQSVALLTAANTTIQNAAKSSTGLRTIAARLRSTTTELDELGESMTEAQYGELVAALTKYNVALTDANGEFRSTYDIVADIAAMWEELSTMEQAALANAIAGVRQQSVFYSLVEQFQEASGAMDDMANSAGTLQRSYATFMESTTAHINQFKAAFQALSQSTFTTDFLNNIVDTGTNILRILDAMARVISVVGGLNTVLYVTVGIIATIKADALLATLLKLVAPIKAIITSLQAARATGVTTGQFISNAFNQVAASASAAQIAVAGFFAAFAVISIIKNSIEGARQKAIELAETTIQETKAELDRIDALKESYAIYKQYANQENRTVAEEAAFKSAIEGVTEAMGGKKTALENLTAGTEEYTKALEAQIAKELEAQEIAAKERRHAAKVALEEKSWSDWNGSQITIKVSDTAKDETNAYKLVQEVMGDFIDEGKYYGGRGGGAMELEIEPINWDSIQDVDAIVDYYYKLIELKDALVAADLMDTDDVYDIYGSVKDVISDIGPSVEEYVQAEYDSLYAAYEKMNGVVDTAEEFTALREYLNEQLGQKFSFGGLSDTIDGFLVGENGLFGEILGDITNATTEVEGTVGIYKASLSDLSETLTNLQSAYTLLETAQKEMSTEDGLSASTIKSLAEASEDYLSYLYEENGVVKLNTEAWRENANAKMQSEMAEIQKEIDSLEAQNAVLQDNIQFYKERQSTGNGAAWDNLIADATKDIEDNTAAIIENQGKLSLYSSLYGSITGDLDAYTTALSNFSNIANTVDAISGSFQTLADLQAEVANGFTMSLDKALEFAAVYPEILNNAQVSTDGQIVLNEDVVNSFLQGKKAELDAQIDTQIAQLEADKAVLEAKMEAAQAQLDIAKNVGEGEGQIAKELAEYRINAGNAVAQAMIDAGVDEATAFKLAAAAMAQNAEEFDRVAMEVCTDVNGNFNQAAYDLAQTMYNNLTNVKTDLASVAKQAHETAKAIAGIADGSIAGSSSLQGGSGGGAGGGDIKLNLTSGSFEGTEYTYTAKESGLEDFISKVEFDISTYEDAIAQIDGQIAVLQALKNAPLKSFKSDRDGGGDGSDGDDAVKDVEEYIAAIDDYREAIERLNRIRIKKAELELDLSNTDDLREQIRLQESLVNIYRDEQDAMHNLNDLRDKTISDGAETLRQLGFNVEYNPDTNKFFIQNLEHLNELVADNKGEYDSLQDATNALREDTEGLIDTLESLNEENQKNSETWFELRNSTREAKIAIIDALKEIVVNASDAVDEIQNVFDVLKAAADEFADNGGFISVDAFQQIIGLGPQYMQYLRDENGLLVINEESINRVIEAKVRQLAAEQALTYVERIRLALQEGAIENLDTLLFATTKATDATFGLAYAELELMHSMGDLNDSQYAAALHNIQAIEDLANTTVAGIGKVSGEYSENLKKELENMKSGLDDILKYVMDMLKHRIQQQIDALEELKDAYGDIIDLRKEALDAAKEEAEYEDKVSEKAKQIAKLQERINALSLDDSRDAQAQKIKLEEEMAELQKELADDQSDYAVDAQKKALDDMKSAYEEEKDAEIAALEETISSYQKLYDMAIDYIESHWNTLYDELITWNTEYGSVLNSEITTAWENCLAAAKRYGSYVAALNKIDTDIAASTGSGGTSGTGGNSNNTVVGTTGNNTQKTKEDSIHAIIKEMYANSQEHHTASKERKQWLSNRNLQLGTMLAQYGVHTHREDDGAWYMDGSKEFLYDKYKKYIYHKGGIAGDNPNLKQNEIMAVLEKGEAVLDEQKEKGLYRLVEFATTLSDKFTELMRSTDMRQTLTGPGSLTEAKADVPANISDNHEIRIEFGDTYISGTNEETVEKHRAITRQQANELLDQLKIKR